MKPRLLLKGFGVMLALSALGWGLQVSGLSHALDTRWVDAEVRGQGLSGELVFLAMASVAVAVGVPRQAICFLAGYAFGMGWGTALGLLASVIGCIACFLFARLLGRELVLHRFAARVRRVDDFLRDSPFSMTVLIRFLPVGSNLLTNLVAGVSAVQLAPFLLGTVVGYLPQTLVFVLLGSGMHIDPGVRITLSVMLFVLSALLGVALYRRFRKGHTLGEEIDEAIAEDG